MVKKLYKARVGAPFKVDDAQEIGLFIEKYQGKTTEEILEIIKKNKNSVIYKYIEWNDNKASELYRLNQVRNIINHIVVEIENIGDNLPVRAFFSVQKEPEEKENVYVSIDATFEKEFYKRQIIERALTELRNWTERYKQYNELTEIITRITEFFKKNGDEII